MSKSARKAPTGRTLRGNTKPFAEVFLTTGHRLSGTPRRGVSIHENARPWPKRIAKAAICSIHALSTSLRLTANLRFEADSMPGSERIWQSDCWRRAHPRRGDSPSAMQGWVAVHPETESRPQLMQLPVSLNPPVEDAIAEIQAFDVKKFSELKPVVERRLRRASHETCQSKNEKVESCTPSGNWRTPSRLETRRRSGRRLRSCIRPVRTGRRSP